MNTWMRRVIVTAGVALGIAQARADDATLKWQTIIGIIQAENVVVPGISGGNQPWSTLGGNASVNLASGRVHFRVDGLVLAGGNFIGTPGPITMVKGTLVCDTNSTTPFIVDTRAVPLDAVGDARFDGDLGVVLPDVCSTKSDAFLIRIIEAPLPALNNLWIANGAVLRR